MGWLSPTRTPAELFAVDVRSLAALRIGLGAVVLVDLAVRATDLGAHYTDAGILPRTALAAHASRPWRLSLHAFGGSPGFEAALFGVAAVFAALLLLGLFTRLATVVSWLLLVSLHARNPLVLQGGDVVLRLLVFWGMFLPLGAAWSLDGARRGSDVPIARRIASPATAALLVQVCLIYWSSAAYKSPQVWVVEGSALYRALSIDQFVTPLGQRLLAHRELLPPLSRAIWWTEWAGPGLAFVPVATPAIRAALVLAFAIVHLGFGLCLALGLFPVISVLAWVPFIPGVAWDGLAGAAPPPDERPVLHGSTAAGVGAFVLLAYVAWWNFGGLNPAWRVPPSLRAVGLALRLDQRWALFAPAPLANDGWYVIPGRLAGGATVDLFRGGRALDWRKPALVSATYPNQRWRKYLMRLSRRRSAVYRPDYARYLCRWNETHDGRERLRGLHLYFMREVTLEDRVARPHRVRLLRFRCPASGEGDDGGAPRAG